MAAARRGRGTGGQLKGLLRSLEIIGSSTLDCSEKNLCRVLLRWADGDGVCWPSMALIARHSGMTVRGVQRILRRLEERGVLSYGDGPGRDGFCGSRTRRIHLDRIKALGGGRTSQPTPDGRSGGPRPRVGGPPTLDPAPPDPGSEEQNKEQRMEQTTTTAASTDADARDDRGAVGGGCGGGGGGGGSRWFAGGPGAAPPEHSVGAGPASPLHDVAEATHLLTDLGVMAATASRLARVHTPEEIRACIAWVRKCRSGSIRSEPGLLVAALRDGTARALVHKSARERDARLTAQRRSEAEALQRDRCERIRRVFKVLEEHDDPSIRDGAAQRLARVRADWPSVESLAATGIVPDDLLFAEVLDATAILESACAAASRAPGNGVS